MKATKHPMVANETEKKITLKMHHRRPEAGQPELMKTEDGRFSLPGYRKTFNDRELAIAVMIRAARSAGYKSAW